MGLYLEEVPGGVYPTERRLGCVSVHCRLKTISWFSCSLASPFFLDRLLAFCRRKCLVESCMMGANHTIERWPDVHDSPPD